MVPVLINVDEARALCVLADRITTSGRPLNRLEAMDVLSAKRRITAALINVGGARTARK